MKWKNSFLTGVIVALALSSIVPVRANEIHYPTGTIFLSENSASISDIIHIIRPDRPSQRKRLDIAVHKLPSLKQLQRKLPAGTRVLGKTIILPNQLVVCFWPAPTDKEQAEQHAAQSCTPDELVKDLQSMPEIRTVSAKLPGTANFKSIGTTKDAVRKIPNLPDNTEFVAYCQKNKFKWEYHPPHLLRSLKTK